MSDPSFLPLAEIRQSRSETLGVSAAADATRRRFLEIMGASIALAAGAGCTRQPTEFIVPYVDPPEHVIPGRPKYYATAALVNGIAQGIIVESHLGRPTKIEGNRAHPASLGATDVLSQACVLDLYDPDRSKQILNGGEVRSWEEFVQAFRGMLEPIRKARGRGLRLLTETVVSPTLGDQIGQVLEQFSEARWHQFDPAGPHSARAGAHRAFGKYVNTYYRLDHADVILALDSDFLTCETGSTRYARDFADRRRIRGNNSSMNRLYAVESTMTATGGKADHRLALRHSEIGQFAADLAGALGAAAPNGNAAPSGNNAAPYSDWLKAVAADLMAHRGASAVIPGQCLPPEVHALCHAINAALGNAGVTVLYTDPIETRPEEQIGSIRQLVSDMNAGAVELLLILGGNPVYNCPADLEFSRALTQVHTSIHLSLHNNETSARTHWQIPETHFLEGWGDARAFDGTITILQPMIEPLYNSRSQIEVLDLLLRFPHRTSYEIVRSYWAPRASTEDFETWWRQSVRTGLIPGSALPEIHPAVQKVEAPQPLQAGNEGALDLVFRPDPYIYDGRYANNAWLQELPRPMTKLTWDNAVHLSPATAKRLKLEREQQVQLKYRGRSVRGSVWISPGSADDTVTVHLGFGRAKAGVVGNGAGFNAYLLRTSDALWQGSGVEVAPTGEKYLLASMQMNEDMVGREPMISRPVADYRSDPDFVKKIHSEPERDETLYPAWSYTGYSWGMSIDLTACVNCSACVIACQAENNIPVVGKGQVQAHRIMHWLRIDTYYQGDLSHPAARYQPVPCMHCEDAPCELVCPVQATQHSADGLNDMVYNRCVGTRYCSNNCPYKVRRFNFLLFNDWYTEQLKMQRNPDVTVRSRGVMEKCTYCVQRIREAEIRSQDEDRFIRDGEIQTACQQVCPTQAIVFGDMNNKANHVARLKQEKLNYSLLAELNTRPHTTYLAELRNPNPQLKESA
ncbi:MAG TPA: 4Fe-4S dicluster domain-containing protein [Terriglobia bacterium]|nr:4Fe-4S dicluster domain-containing protein [Terriglobia bacterium]